MRGIIALALLTGLSPTLAGAEEFDGFARKFFGRPLAPKLTYACFARVYDAAHLARHPRQNVTDLALLARLDSGEPDHYRLTMRLHLRKNHERREAYADCSTHGMAGEASIVCSGSCDGGSVDIKLKDDGTVYLKFPYNASIWNPGPEDVIEGKIKPKFGSDDLLFRFDRAALANCLPLAMDKEEAASMKQQK